MSAPAALQSSPPDGTLVLCGLAAVGGTIHIVAAAQHAAISWTLGAFFAIVAIAQLCSGWWIYHRPRERRILIAAAIANVVVAMLWIWSRTSAMPFGPEAGRVSGVGVADSIATLQELAFAALALIIVRRAGQPTHLLAWLNSAMGERLTYAVLTAALFTAAMGGHQH